jgi:hypothetical protein
LQIIRRYIAFLKRTYQKSISAFLQSNGAEEGNGFKMKFDGKLSITSWLFILK